MLNFSKRGKRSGQAIVEFLMVFIMMIMAIALLMEVGRAVITVQATSSAAFAGVRQGVLTKAPSNLSVAQQTARQAAMENVPFAKAGYTSISNVQAYPKAGQNAPGYPLEVVVTVSLIPIFSQYFLPNWASFNVSRKAVMIMEDV